MVDLGVSKLAAVDSETESDLWGSGIPLVLCRVAGCARW